MSTDSAAASAVAPVVAAGTTAPPATADTGSPARTTPSGTEVTTGSNPRTSTRRDEVGCDASTCLAETEHAYVHAGIKQNC